MANVVALWDGAGLYLDVMATGNRWRWDYQFCGNRRTASLGTYPDLNLTQARSKRDLMKADTLKGIDPEPKTTDSETADNRTFKVVADEWFASDAARRRTRLHPLALQYPPRHQFEQHRFKPKRVAFVYIV